ALYSLTVTASAPGGAILDKKPVRFGFRTIENRDGEIYLNGHPIFLRGIAINPPGRTIAPAVGMSRKFAEDYVKFLRSRNVNIIRLEPESQDWFDVCDEQGMMIFQGVYGAPPTGTELRRTKEEVPDDFESSMGAYRKVFESYVAHPCIVINILSNEMPVSGKRGEQFHAFLTKASDWCKKNVDDTRLYIGNAGYGEGREGDINDVHRYWGWYYNTFLTFYNLRDPHLF